MNVSLSSSTNNYTIGNDTIKTVTQQKDLGILISDSLSTSKKYAAKLIGLCI